jgi:hypothetical protein
MWYIVLIVKGIKLTIKGTKVILYFSLRILCHLAVTRRVPPVEQELLTIPKHPYYQWGSNYGFLSPFWYKNVSAIIVYLTCRMKTLKS